MTRKQELAIEIRNWFFKTGNDKNRWNRDPVGIVIREELERLGQWKYKPRHKPKKGVDPFGSSRIKRGSNG